MKTATGTTVITNGQLIDGTGAPPVPKAVLVIKDGHIQYAGPAAGAPAAPPDAQCIDARSGTIMPGLVEAHIHLTYFNVTELQDLDIKFPVGYGSRKTRCAPSAPQPRDQRRGPGQDLFSWVCPQRTLPSAARATRR